MQEPTTRFQLLVGAILSLTAVTLTVAGQQAVSPTAGFRLILISEAFGLRTIVPAYFHPAYNIKDFAVGVTFVSAGTGYDNAL
ncbi:hypothetical protein RHMOL_Rhmol04G0122900 [Rhododendron molle]|uniref:Uncharacterized protein n=1 Tax=Rhododendron molle TaxID=49168 RepID=A0ACC0NZG4_RHOML|nr:hypothetical protein RHMOL_Rhmol04G0122900 [Rhododendron molle]